MVLHGLKLGDAQILGRNLILQADIRIVEWTDQLADESFAAFSRYGKGQHPAKLNFGDCMSYALAKSLGAPLLYKGDDFAKTDVIPAVAASV